jgi:hypothetical protein
MRVDGLETSGSCERRTAALIDAAIARAGAPVPRFRASGIEENASFGDRSWKTPQGPHNQYRQLFD